MALKLVACTVRGRVQGVFFRASTEREAKRLGVHGWVKNLADGAVELCAEGEEDRLKELVAWVHHGPSHARVDAVDVEWREFTGVFSDFRVVD
jgi:acylphosphatase